LVVVKKSGFKFEKSKDARIQRTVSAWGNCIFVAQNVKWEVGSGRKEENMQTMKEEKNKDN
jgi:hypothetical protein